MQRQVLQTPENSDWKHGLCACCRDPCLCMSASCFPCCLQGAIAHKLDGTSKCEACWMSCLTGCIYNCIRRGHMRILNGIDGNICYDCLITTCCHPLGIVQEARQIGARTGMFFE